MRTLYYYYIFYSTAKNDRQHNSTDFLKVCVDLFLKDLHSLNRVRLFGGNTIMLVQNAFNLSRFLHFTFVDIYLTLEHKF